MTVKLKKDIIFDFIYVPLFDDNKSSYCCNPLPIFNQFKLKVYLDRTLMKTWHTSKSLIKTAYRMYPPAMAYSRL